MSVTGPTDAGFTLLEMLVVLAVTALIAGLSYPVFENAIAAQDFRRSVSTVEAEITEARARAIAGGKQVRFVPSTSLRQGSVLRVPNEGLVFFADGSSNGGTLTLGDGQAGVKITVDRVTGTIRTVR